jgi:ABC-type dipeptide/oligopeptide/nickel transport system permease component
MTAYITRRIFYFIPVFIIVSVIAFTVPRLIPANNLDTILDNFSGMQIQVKP